jgi:excisionase family DNA binding protein
MPTQMPTLVSTIRAERFEPYVSVDKAAQYLDIKRKMLLAKARKGQIPAYPWGDGIRKTWRFKISQLDDWMKSKLHSPHRPPFSERRDFQREKGEVKVGLQK